MDIKQTTLGAFANTEEPIIAPATQENQENTTTVTEPTVEPDATQTTNVVVEAKAEPVEEGNSSDFEINIEDKPAASTDAVAGQAKPLSWQEAIKEVDPFEIAKQVGVSDFAIELDKHIKNGGSALDYLQARAVDYTKVDDVSILKSNLRQEFPTASDAQLDLFINKKYNQSELAEEDDKEFGAMQMQADANRIRQQKIAEQAKFKIAEPVKQAVPAVDLQAQQQAEIEAQKLQSFLVEHEATRNLLANKRVVAKLGEGVSYNFNIAKPEVLMKVIMDGETWKQVTSNDKGEPDVEALQEIALFALNRQKFKADIFNYGKSYGKKSRVEELQNASIPHGSAIVGQQSTAPKVTGSGTLGAFKG